MRQDTLLFLIKDDMREILLAMKKRGLGVGKLNGVGGKIEKGETVTAAAVREAKEEIGIEVKEDDLVKVAEITFNFQDKPDWSIHGHIFITRRWEGEPTESEEMAPEWFSLDNIPYDRMWVDDKYWVPTILRGDYVVAEFNFIQDGSALVSYTINGVQSS